MKSRLKKVAANKPKEISLSNIISGRVFDGEWKDMDEQEKQIATEKILQFVRKSSRAGKIQDELYRMQSFWGCENHAIYDRLVYYPERDIVEYTAGQDYVAEMKEIRKLLAQ